MMRKASEQALVDIDKIPRSLLQLLVLMASDLSRSTRGAKLEKASLSEVGPGRDVAIKVETSLKSGQLRNVCVWRGELKVSWVFGHTPLCHRPE
jgi:hypothetical protein